MGFMKAILAYITSRATRAGRPGIKISSIGTADISWPFGADGAETQSTATVLQPGWVGAVHSRKDDLRITENLAYLSHMLVQGRIGRDLAPRTSNPPVASSNPAGRAAEYGEPHLQRDDQQDELFLC